MQIYDIVAIGNSPKVFIKLLKYTKQGKKTLLINNNSNWNITEFASVKNIEDGCFFIDYKEEDYQLLSKFLDIKLEKLEFEPSFIYKNSLYPISSDFLEGKYNATMIYKYPQKGLRDVIDAIKQKIKFYSIEELNIKITNIFINFDKKYIELNNRIQAKKVLCGYNLNLSKICSNRSEIILNREVTNYFTYILIKIETNSPLNFSLIDFSHCKDNKIGKNIQDKIIFFEKYTDRFLWRVKDLTPFSSLKSNNQKIICIDTVGWLPKKEFEEEIIIEIFNFLKKKNIFKDFLIKEFIYKNKQAFSIEKSISSINSLYSPYLTIVNPLFFDKDNAK